MFKPSYPRGRLGFILVIDYSLPLRKKTKRNIPGAKIRFFGEPYNPLRPFSRFFYLLHPLGMDDTFTQMATTSGYTSSV